MAVYSWSGLHATLNRIPAAASSPRSHSSLTAGGRQAQRQRRSCCRSLPSASRFLAPTVSPRAPAVGRAAPACSPSARQARPSGPGTGGRHRRQARPLPCAPARCPPPAPAPAPAAAAAGCLHHGAVFLEADAVSPPLYSQTGPRRFGCGCAARQPSAAQCGQLARRNLP